MSNVKSALLATADRILARTGTAVAVAAGAGVLGFAPQAQAQIIATGLVSIPIPVNFAGVYVNVRTNATAGAAFASFDVNPYGGSYLRWFAPGPAAQHGLMDAGGSSLTLIDNLAPGTLVDGTAVFTGGTTNRNVELTGATAFILDSDDNYVGFRFFNETTAAINFGWMQIHLGPTITDASRTILRYAYEASGAPINVAAVPEPSSFALLSLGAAGLIARRRLRRQAVTAVVA